MDCEMCEKETTDGDNRNGYERGKGRITSQDCPDIHCFRDRLSQMEKEVDN